MLAVRIERSPHELFVAVVRDRVFAEEVDVGEEAFADRPIRNGMRAFVVMTSDDANDVIPLAIRQAAACLSAWSFVFWSALE